jgi:hypothetical protein
VTLGIPVSGVRKLLLEGQRRPLSVLRRPLERKRSVPSHSLGLLDGSSAVGLEHVVDALVGAIQQGAPAYNAGDVAACFRHYREVALRLMATQADCPGVVQALREGLGRAEALEELDDKAWALRDAFDGLLAVVERWFRAQAELGASVGAQGKKNYPN